MPMDPRSLKKGSHGKSRGFTLVELIVVLVILAILAALLIPSLTGYIDKANREKAISECRHDVLSAQTLASEKYGLGGFADWGDAANADARHGEISVLAETPGTVAETVFDDAAKLTYLKCITTYGVTVIYENGVYRIDGEAAPESPEDPGATPAPTPGAAPATDILTYDPVTGTFGNVGGTLSALWDAVKDGDYSNGNNILKVSDSDYASVMAGLGYGADSSYTLGECKAYNDGTRTAIAFSVTIQDDSQGGSNSDKFYFIRYSDGTSTHTYQVSGKPSIDTNTMKDYWDKGTSVLKGDWIEIA